MQCSPSALLQDKEDVIGHAGGEPVLRAPVYLHCLTQTLEHEVVLQENVLANQLLCVGGGRGTVCVWWAVCVWG